MDNNNYVGHGHASLAVAIIMGILARIDMQSVSDTLKDISVVVSIAAGIMAFRYYYYATKKHK